MSLILLVGKPVWFKWECNRNFVRLCVGPFGVWLLFHDFEMLLERMKEKGCDFKPNAERVAERKD